MWVSRMKAGWMRDFGMNILGEGWWKYQATSLGHPTTLWLIMMDATMLEIIFLGQGWQHERLNDKKLRLLLYAKDEVYLIYHFIYVDV